MIWLNNNNDSKLFVVASRFSLDTPWYMFGWIAASSYISFVAFSIYVTPLLILQMALLALTGWTRITAF